ncbi:putative expansin-A15-like [Capsicum annuum]|nr:putative expansin-A15-like [Capsicum annuum]
MEELEVGIVMEEEKRIRITCQTDVLLVYSVEHTLTPKIDYLVSLRIARNNVVSMILRSPGLLTFSIEKNFKPKVEYLFKEMDRNIGELKKFSKYFLFSLEGKIKPRNRFLVEHGFTMSLSEMLKVSEGEFYARLIKMRLWPIVIVDDAALKSFYDITILIASTFDLEGIARENVVCMILRSPELLTFSIEKNFRPKVEYLLKEMDRDIGELKKFPQYFSFSLEGKIKPRHRILVEHGFTMSLSKMLMVRDRDFNAKLKCDCG